MGKCKGCKRTITWADTKAQYGRLKRADIDEEIIKATLPRCQKCLTRWLKENKK